MSDNSNHRPFASGLLSLSRLITSLFEMLAGRRIKEIDLLFSRADVAKLAPEYLLGLLRGTFVERGNILMWTPFLERVTQEFIARDRRDIDELLQGLQGHG